MQSRTETVDMGGRRATYCRLVGLKKIYAHPMDVALRKLTAAKLEYIHSIEAASAELRKALLNPADPDPLSRESTKLINILMSRTSDPETVNSLAFLNTCPGRLIRRPKIRDVGAA